MPIMGARSLSLSPKYELDFLRPSKPVENAFIEGIHGRLRDEDLAVHHFTPLAEGQTKNEAWRLDEKQHRPQCARPSEADRVRRPTSGEPDCRKSRLF